MRAGDVPFPAPRQAVATWDGDLETAPRPERQQPKSRSDSNSTALQSSSTLPSRSSLGEEVAWQGLPFAQDLAPYQSYAACAEDIHLIAGFLELTPLTRVVPPAVKLLFRVVRFLRLCDYHVEDVCVIMAHASAYFLDFYGKLGSQVEDDEVGNVLGSLIFIAHCYVQDETCPLNVWHKHLFKRYCKLKTLNAAVLQLMKLRQWRLRLSDEDLGRRMSKLHNAIRRFGNLDADFRFLPRGIVPETPGRLAAVAVRPSPPRADGYADRPSRYCS